MPDQPFNTLFAQTPTFGLGLAALGRPGYITLNHAQDLADGYSMEAMQERANHVLDAAYERGVRYFDAARSYGRAEEFLGNWLKSRNISPKDVIVGSKWGYTYTADWEVQAEKHEVKEHSLPVLQRQWDETQTQLGDYLNVYQIHSATLETGVLENTDVLNQLAKFKQDGTYIGLSLSGANQSEVLEKAMSVSVHGVQLFDTAQVTWNLLETSTTEALESAHQAGISIIIKEVVANGRLTMRNQSPNFAPTLAILEQQSKRLETTIDALAITAALAQSWATIVLSGATTIDQLESNLKATAVDWDSEAQETLATIVQKPEVYWQDRSNLAWN